jgi:hypothetical protein
VSDRSRAGVSGIRRANANKVATPAVVTVPAATDTTAEMQNGHMAIALSRVVAVVVPDRGLEVGHPVPSLAATERREV